MLRCDVSDRCAELIRAQSRLQRNQQEFAVWIHRAPACALRLPAPIAADRARKLALSLLANGLSLDYDRWAQASMCERMCAIGFRRISQIHDLYLRQTRDGLELSDLFATVHVDPADLKGLLFSLRRM